MCRVLASIAEDPAAPPSERRRAAMDLIAVGSGRPATTQEVLGKPEAPSPVTVNIATVARMDAAEASRVYAEIMGGRVAIAHDDPAEPQPEAVDAEPAEEAP